jgi:hypothetical protein
VCRISETTAVRRALFGSRPISRWYPARPTNPAFSGKEVCDLCVSWRDPVEADSGEEIVFLRAQGGFMAEVVAEEGLGKGTIRGAFAALTKIV